MPKQSVGTKIDARKITKNKIAAMTNALVHLYTRTSPNAWTYIAIALLLSIKISDPVEFVNFSTLIPLFTHCNDVDERCLARVL